MMVRALITRPWILYMQRTSITPRTLADDLMLINIGESNPDSEAGDMLETFSIAVDATLEFISDMGRRGPSPATSAVLASAISRRARFRKRKWDTGESAIPVKHNVRDLGAHVTFSGTPSGATLNKRADNASFIMDRIKVLPIPATQRSRLVIDKATPWVSTAWRPRRSIAALSANCQDARQTPW